MVRIPSRLLSIKLNPWPQKHHWNTLPGLGVEKEQVTIQNLMKWKSLRSVWLFVTPWTMQSMEFSGLEYWSGSPFPSPGDLPNPRIKPSSLTLQADSLPAEPQGKPKITGVGSLSLYQQIFPTQELNQGLLHCRQVLYQLSLSVKPQGRPKGGGTNKELEEKHWGHNEP